MEDVANLVLTYEKIYDLDGMLTPLRTQAKILASHFSSSPLILDDIRDWDFADAFIMVFSISKYHGFDIFKTADSKLFRKILWLDKSSSTHKSDRKQFIELLDSCFKLVSRQAPRVAEKTIDTLSNLYMLFDKGIIVPRENFLPEILRSRKATNDMVFEAAEIDAKDERFVALSEKIGHREAHYESQEEHVKDQVWWTGVWLNSLLLESAFWDIPFHMWDLYYPLVEYKYQRGARYLPELYKETVVREAFHVLIPEVHTLDIPDLLHVRNCSEFSSFRAETNRVYREVLESPQDFPTSDSLSNYLAEKYFRQIERIALERRPKPSTVLLRNLFSQVHPIIGLILGGREVYEEYRDKHKNWKLAISTLELKDKTRSLARK